MDEKRGVRLVKIPQYVFDKEEQKWIQYVPKKEDSIDKYSESGKIRFRIAQLNVLFDKRFGKVYKPNIVFSPERYEYQLEMYKKLNANFICNNEVTTRYVELMKNSDWIRDNFFMSNATGFGNYMGNLIMSQVPFDALYLVRLPHLTIPAVVGVINDFIICCAHLSALHKNNVRRRIQLEYLYKLFDTNPSFRSFSTHRNVMILGDLNFHSEDENVNIRKDYVDVWKLIHPKKKGYTFSARENKMIKHMWPAAGYVVGIDSAGIQMRLDRFLLNMESKKRFEMQRMKIVANKLIYEKNEEGEEEEEEEEEEEKELDPVPSNIFWDVIAAGVDYLFEWNLWRKKEEFLFPSDHFGMFLEMDYYL